MTESVSNETKWYFAATCQRDGVIRRVASGCRSCNTVKTVGARCKQPAPPRHIKNSASGPCHRQSRCKTVPHLANPSEYKYDTEIEIQRHLLLLYHRYPIGTVFGPPDTVQNSYCIGTLRFFKIRISVQSRCEKSRCSTDVSSLETLSAQNGSQNGRIVYRVCARQHQRHSKWVEPMGVRSVKGPNDVSERCLLDERSEWLLADGDRDRAQGACTVRNAFHDAQHAVVCPTLISNNPRGVVVQYCSRNCFC